MDENKKWMQTGKVGCTFAALFAKNPKSVGWETIQITCDEQQLVIPKGAFILSIQFPSDWDSDRVSRWAISNGGFYQETIKPGLIGLRYKVGSLVSWVQYFGQDSHVITRQAPICELMMCIKLPPHYYFKVGFTGILHLAHASVKGLKSRIADKLWETSHTNTTKRLGHPASHEEAGKVTFKINIHEENINHRPSSAGG